jgi:hypothetical protein
MPELRVRAITTRFESPPVVEETEVRDGRQEFVTIEVLMIAPLLDVGGANRARGWMPEVPKNPENQGASRRKLPRQESPRLRNSSGSLTA